MNKIIPLALTMLAAVVTIACNKDDKASETSVIPKKLDAQATQSSASVIPKAADTEKKAPLNFPDCASLCPVLDKKMADCAEDMAKDFPPAFKAKAIANLKAVDPAACLASCKRWDRSDYAKSDTCAGMASCAEFVSCQRTK